VNRYCVGPAMAVDWGEQELAPGDRRRMIGRVLSYFRPYRRPGLLVAACIAVQAVLGLAPAVVFQRLINTLASRHPSFAHVGLLARGGRYADLYHRQFRSQPGPGTAAGTAAAADGGRIAAQSASIVA
jgi:hypothetical protein